MKLIQKIQKLHFAVIWDGKDRAKYLKKKNILEEIGDNCIFQSRNFPMDPKLVKIHDNVVIAANVYFVTHDAIRHVLMNKNNKWYQMNIGPIEIMDNVFIGLGTIIMPNVRIGKNVIVAAGSLVTKDIPDNCVYAGVPAKKIGDFENIELKREYDTQKYGKYNYDDLIRIKWDEFNKKGDIDETN